LTPVNRRSVFAHHDNEDDNTGAIVLDHRDNEDDNTGAIVMGLQGYLIGNVRDPNKLDRLKDSIEI
jgi:hypothetical protein